MCSLHSISSCKVVVLTCVDDNTCKTVDYSRHELVNKGSLHVDVAEEDTVKGIIQHNIQSLKCTHNCNFRHTQTRTVVTYSNVSAKFLTNLVHCLTHNLEVGLGSISSAESLSCNTVRNIVQQTLSGCTDNGNDISTLSCCSLSLNNILIDVTGSNNYIQVRFWTLTYCIQVVLPSLSSCSYLGNAGINNRLKYSLNGSLVCNLNFGQIQIA